MFRAARKTVTYARPLSRRGSKCSIQVSAPAVPSLRTRRESPRAPSTRGSLVIDQPHRATLASHGVEIERQLGADSVVATARGLARLKWTRSSPASYLHSSQSRGVRDLLDDISAKRSSCLGPIAVLFSRESSACLDLKKTISTSPIDIEQYWDAAMIFCLAR